MKALIKTNALRVDVDASPVYELLLQITAFTGFENLETYDVGSNWANSQRRRCSAHLLRAIDRLGGTFANLDQLMGIQALQPSPNVDGFIRRLEQLSDHELMLHATGFYAEIYPERIQTTIMAAASGSKKARLPAARALSGGVRERQDAVARLLATPAEDVKGLVLELISEWYERIFADDEPSARTLLAADAQAKRALVGTDPERLILIATGIKYGLTDRFGKVLLIPTLVMRPWVAVVNYKRLRIYAYPIVDDPTSVESARRSAVRVYQALANEARLGILKLLAADTLTLDELCSRLEQPAPVVRAHIAVLRAGRIVQINCEEPTTYQLRGDIVRAVTQPLEAYLNLSHSPS